MKLTLPQILKRRLAERERVAEVRERLNATLKPDPAHRARRLAQMSPERAERYRRNIAEIGLVE